MSQQELLKKVIQALDQSTIPYMLTGSLVSSLQGEPRATHGIDMIIAVTKAAAKKLVEAFPPPTFYLDLDSVLGAITNQDMFNLIDVTSGDKVDFWILTEAPFDQSRFSRKITERFMGITLQVSSPEDTILAKLRWAQLSGGSEKQFMDAQRVYEVQYGTLDTSYIEQWAKELNLHSLWKRLKDEAETE